MSKIGELGTLLWKKLFGKKVSQCQKKTEREDPLGVFNNHFVAKRQTIEGGFFRKKNLTVPKKLKGGPFGIFQHPLCRKTVKKIEGGTLWGKFFFRKKVSQCQKNCKGDPLVSLGMVCYALKQQKLFWFNSLDQMVQFGAIIFCRTFELFWSNQVFQKTLTKKNNF